MTGGEELGVLSLYPVGVSWHRVECNIAFWTYTSDLWTKKKKSRYLEAVKEIDSLQMSS